MRRQWSVLVVFGAIVVLQAMLAVLSIDILSSIRAYGNGESLYSKGQKDAYIHLARYGISHDERDYELFLEAIKSPLGYRQAREAMQRVPVDREAASAGLVLGGTHVEDVPGAMRLFAWFSNTRLMRDAVETWAAGDELIERMRKLAEEAHIAIAEGNLAGQEALNLRSDAELLNNELTTLESRFAMQLSDSARIGQGILMSLNVGLAVILGVSGLVFIRRSFRIQASTEAEVRNRQESLQGLLDSTAEGLYGVDPQGRCTFINRAALRLLGYQKEEDLLGQDMHDVVQSAPGKKTAVKSGLRELRPWHLSETELWRKDGQAIPVEFWSYPILRDGQAIGAVSTFFDITERKAMQEAVKSGELRIASLVDAVNDGVIIFDAEERIILFNRAAEHLFQVPAKAAIGESIRRFMPWRMRDRRGGWRRDRSFLDLEVGPDVSAREVMGIRGDGVEVPLEVSISRLVVDERLLVTAVLRDVTELKNARDQRQAIEAVQASSKAKTEFLSRMSHELRTPLNAVLGFSKLVRHDAAMTLAPEQVDRLRHIENAGAHLLALVNDVLDLSRVESGQMSVTMEPLDARASIEAAMAMMYPLAESAGVEMSLEEEVQTKHEEDEGGDSQVVIHADRVRLHQVLVNLISNAVKYNRPGGSVSASLRKVDGLCEIVVRDTGKGIDEAKLPQLFEPFNRLGAEKSKVEGSGIGLVLSKKLVEMMGGSLSIKSKTGRGTAATVTVRCSTQTPVRAPEVGPPSQHGDLDPGLRVLYAEDNEVNQMIVQGVVQLRPSVQLQLAGDGATARKIAREWIPDLMLVDMNLGDMSGLELARELLDDPRTSGIRLVALSADALPEQIAAAMSMGFEDYLTKPLVFRELLDVLDDRRVNVARK